VVVPKENLHVCSQHLSVSIEQHDRNHSTDEIHADSCPICDLLQQVYEPFVYVAPVIQYVSVFQSGYLSELQTIIFTEKPSALLRGPPHFVFV
jgi:hypothetical protein